MRLLIAGGDLRYARAAERAAAAGFEVFALGLEKGMPAGVRAAADADIEATDLALCPNPFDGGWRAPLSERAIPVESWLDRLPDGCAVAYFGSGAVSRNHRERFRPIDLSRDERLLADFARQTAEGALFAAAKRMPFELREARVLLIGYGRIARALRAMLSGFDAWVRVAARKESALCAAREAGAEPVRMEKLGEAVADSSLIFSTPPEMVLDEEVLGRAKPGALLLDLSSPPHGADLEAAQRLGLTAWREPALPGRYCPESAGNALFLSLLRAIEREGLL